MTVDFIDVLSWLWFLFVAWAAVHEWHSVHPAKERRWHIRH